MSTDELDAARTRVARAIAESSAQDTQRTAGTATREAVRRTVAHGRRTGISRFVFENGIVLVASALFVLSFVGQILAGRAFYNDEQRQHHEPTVSIGKYLTTGAFVEATAENWESEFLQMGIFVVLTAFLYQRGSSESKKLDEPEAVDQRPEDERENPDAPWPVRRGGVALAIYKHSLSISLFSLFVISFLLHAAGGAVDYSEEQRAHGEAPVGMFGYLATSRFWFESFQNWQSEFLSVAVLVLFTIWLREHRSAQSKPVAAPHSETGE
jgi:hypothetical protein